jgi:SecD/SecF fusion protein
MKQHRFRIIVVVALLVLGGYLLYPTFRYEQLSDQESELLTQLSQTSGIPLIRLATDIYRDDVDLIGEIQTSNLSEMDKASAVEQINYLRGDFAKSLQSNRKLAIKRGLDLQGGMRLVLEVNLVELLNNSAKAKDEQFDALMKEVAANAVANKDVFAILEGVAKSRSISLSRYWGEPGQSDGDIIGDLREMADDAVDRSREILSNRVDQFGVSEPSINKEGSQRIAVELPGVKDPQRARDLVGRTALLEFKLLAAPERSQEVLLALDEGIERRMKGDTVLSDSLSTDSLRAAALADTGDTSATTNPFLRLLTGRTDGYSGGRRESRTSHALYFFD